MDRSGGERSTSFRLPAALSIVQLQTSIDAIIAAIQAISLCLVSAERHTWVFVEDEPSLPPDDSNVRSFLQLFYTNASDMFAVDIPSPDPALFVTTGKYAGIKVNLRDPAIAARFDALTVALEATIDELGNDRDPVLVAGGK